MTSNDLYQFVRHTIASCVYEDLTGRGPHGRVERTNNSALMAVETDPRDDVREAMLLLRGMGYEIILNPGDRWQLANRLAERPARYIETKFAEQGSDSDLIDSLIEEIERVIRIGETPIHDVSPEDETFFQDHILTDAADPVQLRVFSRWLHSIHPEAPDMSATTDPDPSPDYDALIEEKVDSLREHPDDLPDNQTLYAMVKDTQEQVRQLVSEIDLAGALRDVNTWQAQEIIRLRQEAARG